MGYRPLRASIVMQEPTIRRLVPTLAGHRVARADARGNVHLDGDSRLDGLPMRPAQRLGSDQNTVTRVPLALD